jgi:hypothetical protein
MALARRFGQPVAEQPLVQVLEDQPFGAAGRGRVDGDVPGAQSVRADALLEHIAKGIGARIVEIERKPLGRYAATLQMDGYYKPIDISICPAIAAAGQGGEDARIADLASKISARYPTTLRAMFCDDEPTGQMLIEAVSGRAAIAAKEG